MNIQRILVSNGFTINNRKKLAEKIGDEKYKILCNELRSIYKTARGKNIIPNMFKLNDHGDFLQLTLGIKPEQTYTLVGKQLNFDNIYEKLLSIFESNKKREVNFEPSKTIERLYSPEFEPKRHKTEDGYFVTTVIDRLTGKPEEVYTRLENKYKFPSYYDNNSYSDYERWTMYRKNPYTKGYERIGWREFEIDKERKLILPGQMETVEGNKRYSGIGIRLHQLGIERMMQFNLNNVRICSTSEAFPFHYKCGFRIPQPFTVPMDLIDYLLEEEWSTILKVPAENLRKKLILSADKDMQYNIDNKGLEEIKKQLILKTDNKYDTRESMMELSEKSLRQWTERIQSQPIIMDAIEIKLNSILGAKTSPRHINFDSSKTLKKLFSPEFAPKQHVNKDGYYVTTIINKKTGKPVEAYVRQEAINSYEQYIHGLTTPDSCDPVMCQFERWAIYVNRFNRYIKVGKRDFEINYHEKKITPGYMESTDGNKKYGGIGIRLHQIGVERLIQEYLNTIVINSIYEAFPFHYKCGFRIAPENKLYDKTLLREEVELWSNVLGLNTDELLNKIILEDCGYDTVTVDYKLIEQIKKALCLKDSSFEDTSMELYDDELRKWMDLAESQPIFCH